MSIIDVSLKSSLKFVPLAQKNGSAARNGASAALFISNLKGFEWCSDVPGASLPWLLGSRQYS